eukprot:CCRYP_013136-RA/>CCRYP_013136-RA protein AED:0.42 eAED:0.42 QI:0/-1/0/1/-1/1/1/0/177
MCFTISQSQESKGRAKPFAMKQSVPCSPPCSLLLSSSQLSQNETDCHEHHCNLGLDDVPIFLPICLSVLGSENETNNKEIEAEDALLSIISQSAVTPHLSLAKGRTQEMKEVVITRKNIEFLLGRIPPPPFSFPDVAQEKGRGTRSESESGQDSEIKRPHHKFKGWKNNGAKLEILP